MGRDVAVVVGDEGQWNVGLLRGRRGLAGLDFVLGVAAYYFGELYLFLGSQLFLLGQDPLQLGLGLSLLEGGLLFLDFELDRGYFS